MKENNKGQQVTLATFGLFASLLVVGIITASIGSRVIFQVDNTFTDGTVAENITRNADQGMQQFAELLPVIGILVVASLVIGIMKQFL